MAAAMTDTLAMRIMRAGRSYRDLEDAAGAFGEGLERSRAAGREDRESNPPTGYTRHPQSYGTDWSMFQSPISTPPVVPRNFCLSCPTCCAYCDPYNSHRPSISSASGYSSISYSTVGGFSLASLSRACVHGYLQRVVAYGTEGHYCQGQASYAQAQQQTQQGYDWYSHSHVNQSYAPPGTVTGQHGAPYAQAGVQPAAPTQTSPPPHPQQGQMQQPQYDSPGGHNLRRSFTVPATPQSHSPNPPQSPYVMPQWNGYQQPGYAGPTQGYPLPQRTDTDPTHFPPSHSPDREALPRCQREGCTATLDLYVPPLPIHSPSDSG